MIELDKVRRSNDLLLSGIEACRVNWTSLRKPHVSVDVNADAPVPPLANRRRIQGEGANADPTGERFVSNGAAECRAMVNIAEVYGMIFDSQSVVLDWGVGCARIFRHLPKVVRSNAIGLDVDPINIDWNKKNIGFGQFHTIMTRAHTLVASDSVDLIYSHSVFTHLDEPHQDFWLGELARMLKPGGLAIVTAHVFGSLAAIAGWARDPALLAMYLDVGFINAPTPNPDISDVTDPQYYRDVHHSPVYIRDRWPRFGLEVVDIMIGGFGHVQDVIVCRKP